MKKPKRKPRRISASPIVTAMLRASRLTDDEVAQIINPLRMAIDKMRRCCADHDDYVIACSAARAAKAIERSRIVHGLADEIAAAERALRAEVDALRLNAASVQPELVAVALAACDAVDDLIEKWYATRESGCLPNQVVRAMGASKLLRASALEGTK